MQRELGLKEMPLSVKQKIVEFVDSWNKMSLRQCSKEYKDLVANSPTSYQYLLIQLNAASVEVKLQFDEEKEHSRKVEFQNRGTSTRVVNKSEMWAKTKIEDDWKLAVEKVVKIFNNPMVYLKDLEIKTIVPLSIHEGLSLFNQGGRFGVIRPDNREFSERRSQFLNFLGGSLALLPQEIAVKHFTLRFDNDQANVLAILPHLKPGTLKTIKLGNSMADGTLCNAILTLDLDEVVQLPQWNQAREFHAMRFAVTTPFSRWSHFKWSNTSGLHLTLETVQEMVEILLQMNTMRGKIDFMDFDTDQNRAEIMNWLNQVAPEEDSRRRIRMPGSDLFLEIKFMCGVVLQFNIV